MSMKIETKLARNAQADPELDWLGRSGVEVARYVVGQSMNNPNEPFDALNQFWAGGFARPTRCSANGGSATRTS